jgi:hypothetical protein
MIRALYLILGLAVIGSSAMADTRGWFGARPATVRNVPRSIRDNPGAYRALYNSSPRWFGGK